MTASRVDKSVSWSWIAGLAILLVCDITVAASPPRPETAEEIERALSFPDATQPESKWRGGERSDPPAAGKMRGLGAIVADPADSYQAIDSSDYVALIHNRPRTAAAIHFDTNSVRIRDAAHRLLNEYVSALESPGLADAVFVIAGHTDAVGSEQYNLTLSRQRAQAVKEYLLAQGIQSRRLIVQGYGEAYPVASNNTETGRELNRRSEFIRVR